MTCKINGCPLPAEFITDWKNGKPKWGMCRYHRQSEPSEWKYVTARIHEYMPALKLFAQINAISDPLLLPLPGELVVDWIDRVRENLRRVITRDYGRVSEGRANFAEVYHLLGKEDMGNAKKN